MTLIDNRGRLFGLVNLIDLSLLITFLAIIGGLLWVKTGHSDLNNLVKAEGPADVTLAIRGARIVDPESIKKGNKVFITIRNQPYAAVEIVDVKWKRRPDVYFDQETKKQVELPSTIEPYVTDYEVTIRDNAQATEDGIVLGGNKVKVGIPLELEGFNFRLTGSIINVKMPGVLSGAPQS